MSVAYANPDLYTVEAPSLRRYLGYSFFLHVLLASVVVGSIIFHFNGNPWGDIGGGSEGNVKVNLVGSVGLPMKQPPQITERLNIDPTDII